MSGVRGSTGPGSRAAGFTLVGLLLVLVIINILAALARPALHRAMVKGRAVDVVADLNVIKAGALSYEAEHHEWPPDGNRGVIPPGLSEFLPGGFSFRTPEYILDYDNWAGRRGTPFDIGVTFIIENKELGRAVLELLGTSVWTDGRSKYTWVIGAS